MLCAKIIERRTQEEIERKRAIERQENHLSIVKGNNATFTVLKMETEGDEGSPVRRTDSPNMKWLEMAGEDSSDLEF